MKKRERNGKSIPSGRDAGGFIALPWSVVDSEAYMRLSPYAKCLLIDVARQFVRNNNGRLLLSMRYLRTRGWKSCSMVFKAKKELLEGGFIFETFKGHRPNRASWFAVTWQTLDKLNGYDVGAEQCFQRGAYSRKLICKNSSLSPPKGVMGHSIAPSSGSGTSVNAPSQGAVDTSKGASPTPLGGNHLEITISKTKDDFWGAEEPLAETRIREDELKAANFNFTTGEFEASKVSTKTLRQQTDEWVQHTLSRSNRKPEN